MQIFLAVAVLVYSVVIGTARYDARADNLTECGDKLKELIRAIDKDREAKGQIPESVLADYQTRYSDIVTDSENHTRSDYYLATLEMRNYYFLTGIPRLQAYCLAYLSRGIAYLVPVLMILFEVVFIIDMIGVTSVLVPYLNGARISGG